MFDIKLLRENLDMIKANAKRRGCDVDVDALAAMDKEYLALIKEVEDLRAKRNALSKECQKNPEAREQVKAMKVTLGEKEAKMEELKAKVEEQMSWMPNLLSDEVPEGKDDNDNVAIRFVGNKPEFPFKGRDHQAIGEILGIIDTARGAKVAAAGFYYWVGKGAQLTQAMYFWAQKELVARGFTLFMSPCLAKERTLYGTGYLPFFRDQTYPLQGEDLALIGTSEQTLVAYHADETLEAETLPRRYTAYTPCFRTEAGSYGKVLQSRIKGEIQTGLFGRRSADVEEGRFIGKDPLDEAPEILAEVLGIPFVGVSDELLHGFGIKDVGRIGVGKDLEGVSSPFFGNAQELQRVVRVFPHDPAAALAAGPVEFVVEPEGRKSLFPALFDDVGLLQHFRPWVELLVTGELSVQV